MPTFVMSKRDRIIADAVERIANAKLGDAPREVHVPLTYPVTVAGAEYRALTARRLRGADMMTIRRAKRDREIALFSLMCDVPITVIEALDADDFMALATAAAPLLPRF